MAAMLVELQRAMSRRSWTVNDLPPLTSRQVLPPDLTGMSWWCDAPYDDTGRFGCTRPAGHTGRHAAGDGDHIVAVWP